MTPNHRPATVHCAGCGQDKPARGAREAVLVWSLSNCGEGTLTRPRFMSRLAVYMCEACQVGAFENTAEIRELLGRVANVCRMLAQFMAPKHFAGVKHRPSAEQTSLEIETEERRVGA